MLAQLLRRKTVDEASADAEAPEGRLKRTLGPIDLTALGVGAIRFVVWLAIGFVIYFAYGKDRSRLGRAAAAGVAGAGA